MTTTAAVQYEPRLREWLEANFDNVEQLDEALIEAAAGGSVAVVAAVRVGAANADIVRMGSDNFLALDAADRAAWRAGEISVCGTCDHHFSFDVTHAAIWAVGLGVVLAELGVTTGRVTYAQALIYDGFDIIVDTGDVIYWATFIAD